MAEQQNLFDHGAEFPVQSYPCGDYRGVEDTVNAKKKAHRHTSRRGQGQVEPPSRRIEANRPEGENAKGQPPEAQREVELGN